MVRSVLVGMVLLIAARDAHAAGRRVTFPYRDAEYLWAGESKGGMAFVPDAASHAARVPLVVFFHGVNVERVLHFWSGGHGEPDLAELVDQSVATGASKPFVFAAPSQTRGAMSGLHMWGDFDLDAFVDAVDGAIGPRVEVDRDRVILVGHSGGGCNVDGGVFRATRGRIAPRAILAIDTCMDPEDGAAYGEVPASTQVMVRWQSEIWPRPVAKFEAAFEAAATASGHEAMSVELVGGLGDGAHEAILVETFRTWLPGYLGGVF